MATSFTHLAPNTNNSTARAMEDEAKPAVEYVKSNKGRKPNGKGPCQKKHPQRGMGVAQLERLRKMTETRSTTTTTQFPSEPIGTSNVPALHGLANYGVPMMINGGSGGLWGWGDTAGLVMQRVVGNGGLGGLNGQVLVGAAPASVQVGCGSGGFVETSKELSSMPKLQHCKPDRCDVCFKKKRCNGETVRFNGGFKFNQFGQVSPIKGADFHGCNLENYQNINEEINGVNARAAEPESASAYAGHMNNNQEVVAIHRKGNSVSTESVLMEYEFFPGKSSRSTSSEERKLPAEASVAMGGEASYANASNCLDLSLKLSY